MNPSSTIERSQEGATACSPRLSPCDRVAKICVERSRQPMLNGVPVMPAGRENLVADFLKKRQWVRRLRLFSSRRRYHWAISACALIGATGCEVGTVFNTRFRSPAGSLWRYVVTGGDCGIPGMNWSELS